MNADEYIEGWSIRAYEQTERIGYAKSIDLYENVNDTNMMHVAHISASMGINDNPSPAFLNFGAITVLIYAVTISTKEILDETNLCSDDSVPSEST